MIYQCMMLNHRNIHVVTEKWQMLRDCKILCKNVNYFFHNKTRMYWKQLNFYCIQNNLFIIYGEIII